MFRVIVLICLSFLIFDIKDQVDAFPFENCADIAATGNCSSIVGDGAIGAQSINSIALYAAQGNLGPGAGCPFQAGACSNGFSYYGWLKFFSYVTPCENYGVVVSTQAFAIHLLGNGRLAVYAWMDNDQEWYAESAQPIALGFWGPVALLFDYDSTLGNGTLILYYQGQPIAFSNCTGSRTFTPASQNLVFGGDGVTQDHFAPIQIDRSFWDGTFKNVQDLIAWLTDVSARQGVCMGKPYSTLTNLMHCYWVVQSPTKNWNDAFTACGSTTYNDGYPYGRLAHFDSSNNFSAWFLSEAKLSQAGQGAAGYVAWMGAGKRLNFLAKNGSVTGETVPVPPDVTYAADGAGDQSCLALNTKTTPWQYQEMDCGTVNGYICEMAYDCIPNPCQNFGSCLAVNDGQPCRCFPGTSGKFCETGMYMPYCENNCPCSLPAAGFCYALSPVVTALTNAKNCHKTLTDQLRSQLLSLNLMYNSTLETQLQSTFETKYNSTYATMTLERPYTSRLYENTTWIAYLNYRLSAKINLWYTKAMMIDNSTQTTALVNQVQGCIQTYEEQKTNSDFLNALAKRSQAEKDDWSAVFLDNQP